MRIAYTGALAELTPGARASLMERRARSRTPEDVAAATSGAGGDVAAATSGAGADDGETRGSAGADGATVSDAASPENVAAATSGTATGSETGSGSGSASETARQVRAILERVRVDGDAALREMARELDGVDLESLEVPRARWQEALDGLDPATRRALERAAANIERFHRAQLPPEAKAGVEVEIEPGVVLGRRAVPLAAAGVYAPGGRAAYPSSVLMGVVPARAAGVRDVVVCSPPGPSGEPPAEVLAACAIAGASRLFAVGGAGAIGAMAFGTATIPKVDAVVGPGNRWVTEAKRQVAGDVVIDSPAGPSEVLVLAQDERRSGKLGVAADDPTGRPGGAGDAQRSTGNGDAAIRARRATLIALELVAQAEHDPDAAVVLATDSADVLAAVRSALEREVAAAPRRAVVEAALAARGALLLTETWDEAIDFAEAWAAEHLALFSRNARGDLARLTTAGTVFLGESSAVAFGDYMTGANHVLPTAGLSRALSGLSTLHFLRFFTYQELSPEGARAMSAATACLAEAEGLPGHAAAARARAGSNPTQCPANGEEP